MHIIYAPQLGKHQPLHRVDFMLIANKALSVKANVGWALESANTSVHLIHRSNSSFLRSVSQQRLRAIFLERTGGHNRKKVYIS